MHFSHNLLLFNYSHRISYNFSVCVERDSILILLAKKMPSLTIKNKLIRERGKNVIIFKHTLTQQCSFANFTLCLSRSVSFLSRNKIVAHNPVIFFPRRTQIFAMHLMISKQLVLFTNMRNTFILLLSY